MTDEMDRNHSKLVVVGHSFGGAAVFSAVSSYIKAVSVERLAEETLLGGPMPEKITGFGDSVVLVNPAFEALLYDDFDYLANNIKAYRNNQHVVLMIVGADNDRATGILFPIGQALKRMRERRQRGQFRKICTSVSNYPEFATHRLRPRNKNAREGNRRLTEPAVSLSEWRMPDQQGALANDWLRYVPASRGWNIESVRKDLPQHYCFMVIESVERLVDGHNGIFTKLFVEFLRDFLIGQDLALEFDAETRSDT
jgi:hypothetical protein